MGVILLEKTGQIFNPYYIDRFFHDLRHAIWGRQSAKKLEEAKQVTTQSPAPVSAPVPVPETPATK